MVVRRHPSSCPWSSDHVLPRTRRHRLIHPHRRHRPSRRRPGPSTFLRPKIFATTRTTRPCCMRRPGQRGSATGGKPRTSSPHAHGFIGLRGLARNVMASTHQGIYASMYENNPDSRPGRGCPAAASTAHPRRQLQNRRERRLARGPAAHDRAPRTPGSISNPDRRPRSMSGRQPRRCRRSAGSRRRGTIPVILVDANLLVYAHVGSFPQHGTAQQWLDDRISGRAPVGLPWPSLLAFVRFVSNPRIFDRPASVLAAWQQVESWLAAESTWISIAHRTPPGSASAPHG